MKKWWTPSKPNELQPIPWLAPAVIAYLENLIQPDWEIIEHGSGGSTLWFAERAKCVMAFENNPEWERTVERNVSARKVALVSGFANPQIGPQYNLILIDGEPIADRAKWIAIAPRLIKPGGWIVLDNANRPEYKTERRALLDYCDLIKTFNSNEGGTEHLVTEFYRVKKGGE